MQFETHNQPQNHKNNNQNHNNSINNLQTQTDYFIQQQFQQVPQHQFQSQNSHININQPNNHNNRFYVYISQNSRKYHNFIKQKTKHGYLLIFILLLFFLLGLILFLQYIQMNYQTKQIKLNPLINQQTQPQSQNFDNQKLKDTNQLIIDVQQMNNLNLIQGEQNQMLVSSPRAYVYGDLIDFTKIKKSKRILKKTALNPDNLDKAAHFYNLLGKDIQKNDTLKQIADMEIRYYDQKYQITQFQKQIQFCVLILSYNNEPQNRYKANLDSLFQQNYQNYFVIYVNDASTDRTGQLVQQYMNQHPIAKQKMILVNRIIRKTKSKNQYEMGHKYCKPGSIMFVFDGDDCLIGRQTFKLVNSIYQKKQASFVYLNFLRFIKQDPQKYQLQAGFSGFLPQNIKKSRNYRKGNLPMHMITWISDIFLNISLEDYTMNGQFVEASEDQLLMYSLQELAGDNVYYVPQIVYSYNQDTGINISSDQKKLQQRQKVIKYARNHKKLQSYNELIKYRLKAPNKYFKLPQKIKQTIKTTQKR